MSTLGLRTRQALVIACHKQRLALAAVGLHLHRRVNRAVRSNDKPKMRRCLYE